MVTDRLASNAEFRELLAGVARISAAVNTVEPLGNVLSTVAETICGFLDYDFSAVLLPDPTNQILLIQGFHGLSPAYVETVNSQKPFRIGTGPYGEGPSSRAFRSLQPVVIRDFLHDPGASPWAGVAIEQGYASLAAIPLIVSGQAIGTMNSYTRSIHDFAPEEILLLSTVANQAASAIVAARLREQERATIVSLESARRVLERSEEIHRELTAVVLADAGLNAIASALGRTLAGRVVIDDTAGVVLAGSATDTGHEGSAMLAGASLPMPPPDLLDDRQPRVLTCIDAAGTEIPAFLAPVTIGREIVARLWVLDPPGELGALERRALEHGSTVIALELLKQRIANEVETRLGGELLDDLLDGRTQDLHALRARASHLKFDLAGRHAALVVSVDEREGTTEPELASSHHRQLTGLVSLVARRRHARALVGERHGSTVVLFWQPATRDLHPARDLADTIRTELRRALGGATVSVAVGPWVDDLTDAPRSHAIARGAAELARRAGKRDQTVSIDDLGVYGLLMTVGQLDELIAFAAATIGPIRDYDQRRGSDLLPTLRAYLRASCRTADAAAALVVHPNTVSYRIRRIEGLLDLDLTQPEALLQVQLALVVDEVIAAEAAARSRAGSGALPADARRHTNGRAGPNGSGSRNGARHPEPATA